MHLYWDLFIHKHSKCVRICTDAHMNIPKTGNPNFNLRKSEAPNFPCGCWFSVLCLILYKSLAKVLLQCSITQGFKIKNSPNQKNIPKQFPPWYHIRWKKYTSIETQKSIAFLQLYPHAFFFFFLYILVCLRSNQNWSEQYGTLRTNNSAVNRAFGRMQLCALRREGNAEATQYPGTKETPLMPTLGA